MMTVWRSFLDGHQHLLVDLQTRSNGVPNSAGRGDFAQLNPKFSDVRVTINAVCGLVRPFKNALMQSFLHLSVADYSSHRVSSLGLLDKNSM